MTDFYITKYEFRSNHIQITAGEFLKVGAGKPFTIKFFNEFGVMLKPIHSDKPEDCIHVTPRILETCFTKTETINESR